MHTYEVLLADEKGVSIERADLDLGGLGADPDLRVPTTTMHAVGSGYQVTVRFPADGDWVLVVRVHSPLSRVELFTTKVEGTGGAAGGHGSSATPSRRALLAQDPTFYDRYTPGGYRADAGQKPSSHFAADEHPSAVEALDPVGVAAMLAHSIGAAAWIFAVLGLALAGRLGHGSGRRAVVEFITARYQLLAGGGLAVVTFTGLENVQRSSSGLLHPAGLLSSRLGSAYLAVFVFKMLIVGASMVTTWRIGRLLLPASRHQAQQVRLASVGAMVNDDPPVGVGAGQLFRLAEMNAIFAGAIVIAVSILSQLHHVLH